MDYRVTITIQNQDRVYQPTVLDRVTWETQRRGSPGKLCFRCIQDEVLDISEGNVVKMLVGQQGVFSGYIFSRQWDSDGIVSIIAYDQLRYLKNKDIYQFIGIKASEVVQRIADDFQLEIGEITDTQYVIPKMRASNETLMDIIYTALDHTTMYSGELYILYDDFGKLTLKNIDDMAVPILLDRENTGRYRYGASIDSSTYNRIKLYHDNRETGKREVYISQDSETISQWGMLQLCESINPKQCVNPAQKADTLLQLHNAPQRDLTLRNVFGDNRVRGGSGVYVDMEGSGTGKRMLVESAKHSYSDSQHMMDLQLRGVGI